MIETKDVADSLPGRIASAGRWSAAAELMAKMIAPVSNMILARLLTPDAFGMVATVVMIVSFAEIFIDAGFQKYLIQHEFENEAERERNINVAFWSNLIMSVIVWLTIAVFSRQLAIIVGNPEMGTAITVAGLCIILEAFSSIQTALFRRQLDFKTLFRIRMLSTAVPLVVTVPLAFLFRSYWALIAGMIAMNMVNAVSLTCCSNWKPRFYYSFRRLKKMLSFTSWSMAEAVTVWLTGYADIFLIGLYLSDYYLGLYKITIITVGQITGLITATLTPILFASLSRLQYDRKGFADVFLKFQRITAMAVFPLGVMLFCYGNLAVEILLGDQWRECVGFVGIWGITGVLNIVLSHNCFEAYRALGRPKVSVMVQMLHVAVLVPAVWIAVGYGFEILYIVRSLVRLQIIVINIIMIKRVAGIGAGTMMRNMKGAATAATVMLCSSLFMPGVSDNIWTEISSAVMSLIVYVAVLSLFGKERMLMVATLKNR